MPKCILHVGMHKTGTTSLQHSLKDLADSNFYYARLLDKPNHSMAIYNAFAQQPEKHPLNRNIADNEAAMRQAVAAARRDLATSIEAAAGRTLVLSGEGMLRMSGPELRKLKGFLKRHGHDQFEVIAYLRTPAAYISSAVQQRIKSGMKKFNIEGSAPAYRRKFAKLDRSFGRDNVRLFKFDPAEFVGNDVVLDFCAKTGIPATSINLTRKNESISRMVAQLLYQYRQNAEAGGLPAMRTAFGDRLSKALADLDKTKFRLSPKLVQPILDANKQDVAWVEQRLGQSLNDGLGEEGDLDIRSEDDLMTPIAGINDKLMDILSRAGAQVSAQEANNTWRLLHRFARFARDGGIEAGRSSAPGGKPAPADAVESHGLAGLLAPAGNVRPKGTPLTTQPRPLVNIHKNLIVLWSPKCACTTAYVWFCHVSGFLPQMRRYASWPHKHRYERYEFSKLYFDSVTGDLSAARAVRIIRDPYSRAVSIYRHALQTQFADKALAFYQSGALDFDTGVSFQQFLDFVQTLDMTAVDIHFRPQFHPFEAERQPDQVINISKEDLFAGLNSFERDSGLPQTDFGTFDWLHNLEGKRKAQQDPMEGEALDTVAFTRRQVKQLGQFPSYSQLLTPEARQKIEEIYKSDFDAYREFL